MANVTLHEVEEELKELLHGLEPLRMSDHTGDVHTLVYTLLHADRCISIIFSFDEADALCCQATLQNRLTAGQVKKAETKRAQIDAPTVLMVEDNILSVESELPRESALSRADLDTLLHSTLGTVIAVCSDSN